jgi:hypothetical protein
MEATRLRSKHSRSKSKRKSTQKTHKVPSEPPTPNKEELVFSTKTVKL